MIGVVDYRAGNAPSVMFALERLGIPAQLVRTAGQIAAAERIILPGVGAAGATMASLAESELVDALHGKVLGDRAPFLGICIGLQVIFDHSAEGDVDGLGWVPGDVRRFPSTDRVPQIGWNAVDFRAAHPLVAGLANPSYCYFVNSYYATPTDGDAVLGSTEYSVPFCSMVASANIAATQFHAEKSGEVGLSILRNFSVWDGTGC